MKQFSIVILLFLCGELYASSQAVIIRGSEGNRGLQWDDFTGLPDSTSPFYSQTFWNVNYKYSGFTFKPDTLILTNFSVELQLNPEKSWVKKKYETPELLRHEQGHFDVGRLLQLEFLQDVNFTIFHIYDYEQKLKILFSDLLNKYIAMNSQYDEETDHSNNKQKQAEWNQRLEDELKKCDFR